MFNDILGFADPKESIALADVCRVIQLSPLIHTFDLAVESKVMRLYHVRQGQRERHDCWFVSRKVMCHRLIIGICEMQRVNTGNISHYASYFFHLMSISLKLFLLLSQLLVHFKKRNLKETVETTFFEARDGPLNHNVNLFLLISGLHLELANDKGLFLIEVVGLFGAVKNTDYSF